MASLSTLWLAFFLFVSSSVCICSFFYRRGRRGLRRVPQRRIKLLCELCAFFVHFVVSFSALYYTNYLIAFLYICQKRNTSTILPASTFSISSGKKVRPLATANVFNIAELCESEISTNSSSETLFRK